MLRFRDSNLVFHMGLGVSPHDETKEGKKGSSGKRPLIEALKEDKCTLRNKISAPQGIREKVKIKAIEKNSRSEKGNKEERKANWKTKGSILKTKGSIEYHKIRETILNRCTSNKPTINSRNESSHFSNLE